MTEPTRVRKVFAIESDEPNTLGAATLQRCLRHFLYDVEVEDITTDFKGLEAIEQVMERKAKKEREAVHEFLKLIGGRQ